MKPKRTYKKARKEIYTAKGWLDLPMVFEPTLFYIRNIRTAQEIRAAEADKVDAREDGLSLKIRKARAGYAICSWNLEPHVSMAFKRSWKRFYKCKKQWAVNR